MLAPRRRRAVVLLVSVAVLSVLAILATVFATMSRIERTVARNYVDLVRAKLLAQAGIEVGVRVMRQVPAPAPASLTYYGEDHDASGTLANGWGVTEDVYRPGGTAGTLQTLDCPLSYALRPSLWADLDANGRPDVLTIQDPGAPGGTRQVGFSGALAGTYQGLGDTFSIRIVDQNDLLDVNDVMVNSGGATVEPNTRMARVINTLAQVLGLAGNEGTLIANWRAAFAPVSLQTTPVVSGSWTYNEITGVSGGFSSVDQLSQILSPNSYAILKNYLSVGAWKDLSTIRPQPQTFAGISPLVPYYLQQAAVPADKYNCQYRFEPRAPINVNTAPWAVLVAAVSGVQANYVAVVPAAYNGATDTERYEVRSSSIPTYSGAASTPARIASTIVWYRNDPTRGPFGTWEQWNSFVDTSLVQGGNPFGSPIINPVQGKILKAMCNPNTRSMRMNPDRCMRFRQSPRISGDVDIDKTDLAVYSTEFCFSAMGTFSISSHGRVVDEGGNLVASYQIQTVVKAYETLRHTTARDFRRYSVSNATQYVATLPDSPPDHDTSNTSEDRELGTAFDVRRDDPRWAYDGGITQRTRDPNGILERYIWPSTTATQGGGTGWMTNPGGPSVAPMGFNSARIREDRSLFGAPSGGAGGPGDSLKGDIFSDGLYLGSDRYRALTYALPWSVNTTAQAGANATGMSLEYWMKPNCEGSSQIRMRRGYQYVRSDLGTQTVQLRVWQRTRPNSNTVTWDGRRYAQFSAHWWEAITADNHDGFLEQWGYSNFDPSSFSGFSIVTSAPNERFGVQWDWRSTTAPPWLYTGMWHHFYLGTWDEGYYTASEMFVDGVQQGGVLARYGAPTSGWVTVPFVEQVGPFSYLIWFWVQPMVDMSNIVDVACSVHDSPWGDEPPSLSMPGFGGGWPDPDREFAGTMDGFRMRQARTPPGSPPSRLNPGVNAQYGATLDRLPTPLPGKELPQGSDITIMSVEWTRYRPNLTYAGTTIPANNRPTTVFSFGVVGSGFAYTLADTTGKPQPPQASGGFTITSSQTFQYRIRFDNLNISPLRESAYFDDITFHYYDATQPVQFVSWQVQSVGE